MSNILEIKHLKKYFRTSRGMLHAVDDVSFTIPNRETMGVVGESGCGKSTLGRTLIHLLEPTDGQIIFEGKDITHLSQRELFNLRSKMQIIFQDPYSSLNPRMSVQEIIAEPMKLAKKYSKAELKEELDNLMELCGIDQRMRSSYPHELDGGRRQRVGIARAIALNPKFIVCDEPVSALDVSIQAQVLNLLQELQEKRGMTYLFVTHNLSVVKHISDRICVMYLGQVVETCASDELFKNPVHPYTQALLSAIPSVDIHHERERIILKGEITSPIDPKPSCRFFSRCPFASEECKEKQQLKELVPGHFVACCKAAKGSIND